jgi:hypothetical protein
MDIGAQMNTELAQQLVSMMELDQNTFARLAAAGEIGPHQPYHPRLREIHEENTRALAEIIDKVGWPTIPRVGRDGAEAAWLIAQHAVLDTEFMSSCADLLEVAVAERDVDGWQLAFLRDRLQTMSGEKQIYGTQFDQDSEGWPIPFPIQDEGGVDERRRELGLNSLEERLGEMRVREKAIREAVSKAGEDSAH